MQRKRYMSCMFHTWSWPGVDQNTIFGVGVIDTAACTHERFGAHHLSIWHAPNRLWAHAKNDSTKIENPSHFLLIWK